MKASVFRAGKQNVSFKARCNVILIPSRQEYLDYDISLWNDPELYEAAKNEVFNDISSMLDEQPNMNFREAVTQLFQPENMYCTSKSNDGSALQLQNLPLVPVYGSAKLHDSPKSVSDVHDIFFIGEDRLDSSDSSSCENMSSLQLSDSDTDRSTF